jgi:hypothetical protein
MVVEVVVPKVQQVRLVLEALVLMCHHIPQELNVMVALDVLLDILKTVIV